MPTPQDKLLNIEQALTRLGKEQFVRSESSLNTKVDQQIKIEKRHALWAIAGFMVALLAAVIFVLQKESFGYFAMPLVLFVFASQIYRSRKMTKKYEQSAGYSLLETLSSEAKKGIKQYKYFGPWLLFMFMMLTTYVVALYGFNSLKSWLYILTTLFISIYVVYRFIFTVPELQKELEQYSGATEE